MKFGEWRMAFKATSMKEMMYFGVYVSMQSMRPGKKSENTLK